MSGNAGFTDNEKLSAGCCVIRTKYHKPRGVIWGRGLRTLQPSPQGFTILVFSL